jgi:large subunit ribosomal protein L17
MRHNNKIQKIGRDAAHRKATLSNMACSLITHKHISTTLPKARALRRYIEPLLTKSKTDTTHSRRIVFSELQSKEVVTELFRDVAPRIAERPGGYTRIIKTGFRKGDGAEMCMIELVDFNEIYGKEDKKKTRRSRRTNPKSVSAEAAAPSAPKAEVESVEAAEQTAPENSAASDAAAPDQETEPKA